ncbi:hypothetical protein, partial [Neisseria meningitidis]|uniref:hypothetical protein n=1 Tax=Neisseria meningitidis TaxID=487 RepID=UPI00053BC146
IGINKKPVARQAFLFEMIRLLFNAAAFIPTRVGIYRESRNFSAVIPENLHPVIPTKVGI